MQVFSDEHVILFGFSSCVHSQLEPLTNKIFLATILRGFTPSTSCWVSRNNPSQAGSCNTECLVTAYVALLLMSHKVVIWDEGNASWEAAEGSPRREYKLVFIHEHTRVYFFFNQSNTFHNQRETSVKQFHNSLWLTTSSLLHWLYYVRRYL